MPEASSITEKSEVDPYLLPPELQGWRGLSIPGNHKRKWYTVLHNEQVLVTALLLIPGERSIRHSHETGELSIHYDGEMIPVVTWNPPGYLHPNSAGPPAPSVLERTVREADAQVAANSVLERLLEELLQENLQLRERMDG